MAADGQQWPPASGVSGAVLAARKRWRPRNGVGRPALAVDVGGRRWRPASGVGCRRAAMAADEQRWQAGIGSLGAAAINFNGESC